VKLTIKTVLLLSMAWSIVIAAVAVSCPDLAWKFFAVVIGAAVNAIVAWSCGVGALLDQRFEPGGSRSVS
jgi:hypothetical protein